MIERVKDRFGLETRKLIGDTAYGTAEFLNWMVNEAGIEPHVPVWDRGDEINDRFGRSDYVFDEVNNLYICPNGKELRRFWRKFTKWRERRVLAHGHRTKLKTHGETPRHRSAWNQRNGSNLNRITEMNTLKRR